MDINAKVEQLMQITSALKNEIVQLKGKDINIRLDELEEEQSALRDEILDLRNILTQRNEHILSLINKQNDKLVETIEADKRAPRLAFGSNRSKYSKLFPIKSLEELDELEKMICDDNVDELRSIVRLLLQPKGIIKNISFVMAVPCIMECNVDGHHNKRRLLSSPKFMDLIFRSVYDGGCRKKTFLDEFRRGFKMVKNRHHKNLCLQRQMQRQKEEEEQAENEISQMHDVEILPDSIVKIEETEKIYFD